MLEKSLGVLFFLKRPKNLKQNERYVYLRITVNGTPKELSTKRVWYPDRWNQAIGRATGTKEDSRSLNNYLDTLLLKVHQAKSSLLEADREITAEDLKNIITGKGEETQWFVQVVKNYKARIYALIGNGYSSNTFKRYRTTYDHVQAFVKWKYHREDIRLIDLNYEFAADFAFWLKVEKKCAHNSAMKYVSTLSTILKPCIKSKWIKSDPFADFDTKQKEVEVIPLYAEELNTLRNKKITIERLALVRDIFLFSCYTGLAYVDVDNLKRNQIVTGVDGDQWIITNRQKTGSPQRVPLLKPAVDILEKYKDHSRCVKNGYALPILTNQKMNAYLKEIADICGICKKLTYHIARHTFATTVTLGNGVPIETVSKMLGHKNLKQTQHYAKIIDLKTSQDMMKLKSMFG